MYAIILYPQSELKRLLSVSNQDYSTKSKFELCLGSTLYGSGLKVCVNLLYTILTSSILVKYINKCVSSIINSNELQKYNAKHIYNWLLPKKTVCEKYGKNKLLEAPPPPRY